MQKFSSHPPKLAQGLIVQVMNSNTIKEAEEEIANAVDEKAKAAGIRKRNIAVNHSALPFAFFLYSNERVRVKIETFNYTQEVHEKIENLVQNSIEHSLQAQADGQTLSSEAYFNAVVAPQLNAVKEQQDQQYKKDQAVIMTFVLETIDKYKNCLHNLSTRYGFPSTEKELKEAHQAAINGIKQIKEETEKELAQFKKANFLLLKSPEFQLAVEELTHLPEKATEYLEGLKSISGNAEECEKLQKSFAKQVDDTISVPLDDGFERVREAQKAQIDQFNLMLQEELRKTWYQLNLALQTAANDPDNQEIAITLTDALNTTCQQQELIQKQAWSEKPFLEEANQLNDSFHTDLLEAGVKLYPPKVVTGFDPDLRTAENHLQKTEVTVEYNVGRGAVIHCTRDDNNNLSFTVKNWGWDSRENVIHKMTDIMTTTYASELRDVPIIVSGRDLSDISKCQGSLSAKGINIPAELIVDKPAGVKGFLYSIAEAVKKITPGVTAGISKDKLKYGHSPEFYEAKDKAIYKQADDLNLQDEKINPDIRSEIPTRPKM